MSALDDARARFESLETEQKLIDDLEKANARHVDKPTDANYRRHLEAEQALAEHRSAMNAGQGTTVGGDAYVDPQEG